MNLNIINRCVMVSIMSTIFVSVLKMVRKGVTRYTLKNITFLITKTVVMTSNG